MSKKSYKDQNCYLIARKKYNKKYYARTATFTRERWTDHEDKLVLEHSISDTELANNIGRSVMAIQIRRARLLKNKEKERGQDVGN